MSRTKVKRRNRVLIVEKFEVESYLKQGYDEVDAVTGEVIKRATGGRTISLAEHNKVLDELEQLKKDQGITGELDQALAENEELKKEVTSLKGQVTKLQNAAKETKK